MMGKQETIMGNGLSTEGVEPFSGKPGDQSARNGSTSSRSLAGTVARMLLNRSS